MVHSKKYHKSVLVKEVLEHLEVQQGSWYLDATLGDGGHCLEILRRGGKMFGIDVDPGALVRTKDRFEAEGISKENYILKEGNFRDLDKLVGEVKQLREIGGFRGAIFDLGMSSLQLDAGARGFSFLRNAPLDMRMSPNLAVTAADLVNALSLRELIKLFQMYGEEPRAKQIAKVLVNTRPVTTTGQLAGIVERVVGRSKGRIHPATKVFQALRIAVNDELESIKVALPRCLEQLAPGGRIAVISFHSLEDRIVKNLFKEWVGLCFGAVVTKKPIRPSQEEIVQNTQSRSGKLRVFKKEE